MVGKYNAHIKRLYSSISFGQIELILCANASNTRYMDCILKTLLQPIFNKITVETNAECNLKEFLFSL